MLALLPSLAGLTFANWHRVSGHYGAGKGGEESPQGAQRLHVEIFSFAFSTTLG